MAAQTAKKKPHRAQRAMRERVETGPKPPVPFSWEVIHLQVPLQIPCYDLTLLVEGRLEYARSAAHPPPTKMV